MKFSELFECKRPFQFVWLLLLRSRSLSCEGNPLDDCIMRLEKRRGTWAKRCTHWAKGVACKSSLRAAQWSNARSALNKSISLENSANYQSQLKACQVEHDFSNNFAWLAKLSGFRERLEGLLVRITTLFVVFGDGWVEEKRNGNLMADGQRLPEHLSRKSIYELVPISM